MSAFLPVLLVLLLVAGIGMFAYAFRDTLIDWWQSRQTDTDADTDSNSGSDDDEGDVVAATPNRRRFPFGRKKADVGAELDADGRPTPVDVPWPADGPAVPLPDDTVDAEDLIDVIKAETARLEATRRWLETTQPDSGHGDYADAVSRLRVVVDWADVQLFDPDGWDGVTSRVTDLFTHASSLAIGDAVRVQPIAYPAAFGSGVPTGGVVGPGPTADRLATVYDLLGVARPVTSEPATTAETVTRLATDESGRDRTGLDNVPNPAGSSEPADTVNPEQLNLHVSHDLPEPLPNRTAA